MKCRVLGLRSHIARRPYRRVCPRRVLRAVRCATETEVVTPLVKVTFTIPHHVEFGQSVCVLGSSEALGDWHVDKSASLTWNEGDIWSGVVELPPAPVEYKYFIKNEDGTPAEWQPCENLTVDVEGEDMEVHDEWSGLLQAMTSEQEMLTLVDAPNEPKPLGMDIGDETAATTVSAILEGPIPAESIQNLEEDDIHDTALPVKEEIAQNAGCCNKK